MYRLYTSLSNYKYIITNMCNNLLYTLKCICKIIIVQILTKHYRSVKNTTTINNQITSDTSRIYYFIKYNTIHSNIGHSLHISYNRILYYTTIFNITH